MLAEIISTSRQYLNGNANLVCTLSQMTFYFYYVLIFFLCFNVKELIKEDEPLCYK